MNIFTTILSGPDIAELTGGQQSISLLYVQTPRRGPFHYYTQSTKFMTTYFTRLARTRMVLVALSDSPIWQ